MTEADILFERKVATGWYDHYDEETLKILYEDCVKQVAHMENINKEAMKK